MPIFVIFVGVLFGLSAVNGKVGDLFTQAKTDLFGDGSSYGFAVWAGAIILLGTILRAVDLPEAGKALIGLLILVFLLSHGGLLQSLELQLKSIGTAPSSADAKGGVGQ